MGGVQWLAELNGCILDMLERKQNLPAHHKPTEQNSENAEVEMFG
jgi:hypothetical protein